MSDSRAPALAVKGDYCALPLTEWARLTDRLAEVERDLGACLADRDRLRDLLREAALDLERHAPTLCAKIHAALAKEPQP